MSLLPSASRILYLVLHQSLSRFRCVGGYLQEGRWSGRDLGTCFPEDDLKEDF